MHNLRRMMAAALLALLVLLPTAAVAQESDAPLSDVPSQYVPALRAAAQGLDLSYDELASASQQELQDLLCAKLDETPTDEVVAQAKAALDEAPDDELADLSEQERAQLEANLPVIVAQIESEYCTDGAADDGAGDIPVPTRVDTGGGGAGDTTALPVAFGALFAAIFGLIGVGITGRRSTT